MKTPSFVLFALALVTPLSAQTTPTADRYWPQWRGPDMTGVSKHRDAAARVERDEERPLEGRDSRDADRRLPVVWGDRLFVLDRGARRRRRRRAHAPLGGVSRAARIASSCWRSTGRPARRSGSASRREEAPHEAAHADNGTWASSSADHRRRARLSRTSSRSGSTRTTWTARSSGRRTSATSGCAVSSVKDHARALRQPLVVVWDHLRASRSSPRSTRRRAASCGA